MTPEDENYTDNPIDETEIPENTGNGTESPRARLLRQVTVDTGDDTTRHQLRGMYQSWFLEYASYVILERAVPHIDDGLKPVQRRILHTMKTLDDGRFNKVANIVGSTMQYHPHGDASIYEALIQLGQRELLVETQGNWGNILTGASAAAGRYIEARLSQFALDVLYNPKVTTWTPSYDGRNNEPVTLPAKFPLLLAQGVEGIAVGLSSKILPHNFNELLDAAIDYLEGREFTLYPDFPTGGFIDVSRYNDGRRGGVVKIRAKIEKIDSKTLAITEIPYGKTTGTLIDSILKAFESGKIKIRKVDDNTAREANIQIHLLPGTSSDKTIDALYAFTDCEVSVSPNCCIISDKKPHFLGVSDVLRHSVDTTRDILGRELAIKRDETAEALFFASLERIFIEERIYKDREYEQSKSRQEAITHIHHRLEPWKPSLLREVTDDDIIRLFEIKMGRILRFNADKQEEIIAGYKARIEELETQMANLTEYTIEWYRNLKEKYGAPYQRHTVIRGFDAIWAASVADANEKLYFNRADGFIGTALKKDEPICNCSSLDDIIIFYRDGRYKVVKVQEKLFVGKNILHLGVFRNKDERTVYNTIYQNGKGGAYYMKRFKITGITRDKEYNFTPGAEGTRVLWFSANPNGEAEIVKVTLKPRPRLNKIQFDIDFGSLSIKGRSALGNLVTKNEVHRISLKKEGVSTLGGLKVWFDTDVLRLNAEGRGKYLGEFQGDDRVLVVLDSGEYYTSSYDLSNHYEDNIFIMEKWDANKVWAAALNDADQGGYPYLKRFKFEASTRRQRYISEKSTLLALSDRAGTKLTMTFGGVDSWRDPIEIDIDEFIAVKSLKAKGKRLTTYNLATLTLTEPDLPEINEELQPDETPIDNEPISETSTLENEKSDDEIRDEILGQQRIF